MDPTTYNPNKTKNRVPTDKELASLRAIASRKKEISETMGTQISEAQATYDKIKARHEEQLAVLESIQSELHAAMQHTAMLQTLKEIVDNEMNEICGVIHPIRRMPAELLTQIFEYTVRANWSSNVWQSIQLSHVCQYWRAVALNSPSLWSEIKINFRDDSLSFITKYWSWVVERVKAAPVNVYFYNLGGNPQPGIAMSNHIAEQRRKVAACSLLRIPMIRELYANIDDAYPTTKAFSMITEFPIGKLESLYLSGPLSGTPIESMEWDWCAFLHRFPPTKVLKFQYLDGLYFPRPEPFILLQNLHLGPYTNFNTLEILRLCPNLEGLSIDVSNGYYRSHQTPAPVTNSTLTVLEVTGDSIFPWDAPLHFPSLSFLILDTEETVLPDGIFHFLAHHPSISDLKITTSYLDLTRLATATPQLTKLTLNLWEGSPEVLLDWTSTSLQGPPFPKLEILDLDSPFLTLERFDRFVRTRCLPPTHDKSELPNGCFPLLELTVYLHNHFESQFMTDATRVEGESDNPRLSWL